MEPEGSLSCSQEPSTGPYPEPDHANPSHPILSLVRSILMLYTHLRLGLPSGLFPSDFPTNILYAFFSPFVLHALPISATKLYYYYKSELYILILVRRRERKERPECTPNNKRLTPIVLVTYDELDDRGLIPGKGDGIFSLLPLPDRLRGPYV
jgi:hypothetical protein